MDPDTLDSVDDSGVTLAPPSVMDSLTREPQQNTDPKAEEDFTDGVDMEAELARIQARKEQLISMFHGPAPKQAHGFRERVRSGEISPADYFTVTGRIFSGGTGDTAQRDARGNITGYKSRDGSHSALGGPSSTPGLDAFHEMNPGAPVTGKGFSFMPAAKPAVPVPASVAKTVGSPVSEVLGPPSAVGAFSDRQIVTPFGAASVNFSGAMNRGPKLPAALPKQTFNTVA